MKRFEFSLESVLRVRRTEEQQAEWRLHAAQAELHDAQDQLATAEADWQTERTRWRDLLAAGADARDVLLAAERQTVLREQRETARRRVVTCQEELDQAIDVYRDRRRNREAIEEMRARAWQRWLLERMRTEQNEADDRAVRDYAADREVAAVREATGT